MLTRFKVAGFKNLVDVDVYLGPFTCIAGGNGVGKSNLFDSIMFLSSLADQPLIEAAMSVRDDAGRTTDIRSLFHLSGGAPFTGSMRLEAEMLIPHQGRDDLGQDAEASITFLRYAVELQYRPSGIDDVRPGLQLARENLEYINIGEASKHLPFPNSTKWRKSVIHGRRTSPFISTSDDAATIRLHQEGKSGRTRSFTADSLPRTVLSTVNAAESPTALLARRELQSWRLLQLEPSALRASDSFTAPSMMGSDGSHLPATLFHLARSKVHSTEGDLYARVSNRLSELVDDVRAVAVKRDDARELLTLEVEGHDHTSHPARSLSDGTLRFLALAVLEADPNTKGLICLEEPENGIHPQRIVSMVNLLEDLAVDTDEPVGVENPLRQVIINTHSPTVVAQVPEGSLLLAERVERAVGEGRDSEVVFRCLSGTWRSNVAGSKPVQKGKVSSFLNPVRLDEEPSDGPLRVIQRKEFSQLQLPLEAVPLNE